MPPRSKAKEAAKPLKGFYAVSNSQLPVWDDDQILVENWGIVFAPGARSGAPAAGTGKEAKATKASKDNTLVGSCFVDVEGRHALECFIEPFLSSHDLPQSVLGTDTTIPSSSSAGHADTKAAPAKKAGKGEKGKEKMGEVIPEHPSPVVWRRPAEVSKPFRPVVHRNSTPFVNPYAEAASLVPLNAKEEEAKHKVEVAALTASGKRVPDASHGTGGGEGGGNALFFELYPEAVSLIDDMVGQSASQWRGIESATAVGIYRQLPKLMEPYNPTLVSGCPETPAEACGSRYSTALRHKLQQAEMLEALQRIPPFLMSAFQSVLLLLERVQTLVPKGQYLWELIYPHAPGTCHPVHNPFGKYAVKLFVEGQYRKVIVDDALPVDELGRPLITVTSLRELWPAIIVKAIFKAFGSEASRMFTDDPDLLVSCFVGNYVPEYIDAKTDVVATTAALLTYKMQLEGQAKRVKEGNTPYCSPVSSAESLVFRPGASAEGGGEGSPASTEGSRKRSMPTKKGAKHESTVAKTLEILTAEDFEPPNDDEPVDKKPRIVCAIRKSRTEPPPYGFGSGVQLFPIVAVVNFRNTLALLLETTPFTDIPVPKLLFEVERDKEDVQNVLVRHRSTVLAYQDPNPSVLSVWMTLEEFSTLMDRTVVWRSMDDRYLRQVSIAYDSASSALASLPAGGAQGSKKAMASSTIGPVGSIGVMRAPKQHMVRWCAFKSDRPEELAVVCFAPTPPPPLTPEEEAAAAELLANPSKKGTGTRAAPKNAGKGAAPRPPSPPPPEEVVEANLNSISSTGYPTAVNNFEVYKQEQKMLQMDYYQYNIAEPLTPSLVAKYEYGKLSSTMLRLRPGIHLLRITIPEMEYGEKISLLCDAQMDLREDVTEALESIMVHQVSDAGIYPAIEEPGQESLWFKRRIRVATDTILSISLSTLLPTESSSTARHVSLSTSAPTKSAKGGSNRGAGGKGPASSGGNAAGAPATPSSTFALTEGLDMRRCDIPILQYATLLLINLDNRNDVYSASGGSLSQVSLEANKNGYLLFCYASVPASDEEKIRAAYAAPALGEHSSALSEKKSEEERVGGETNPPSSVLSNSTPKPLSSTTNALTHDFSSADGAPEKHRDSNLAPIYGKGQWKVEIRSNNELAAFDPLTHLAHVASDTSTLERGGSCVFFRHTCTVTESTHLTLMCEVKEAFGVPVAFRITQSHTVPLTTTTAQAKLSDGSEARHSTSEAAEVEIYSSPPRCQHVFIPDVLLELGEKAKSTTYTIEGRVPLDKAEAWDELCRLAQAKKFQSMRAEAEHLAEEQRELAVELITRDPAAFIQQKTEERQEQQQQQLVVEADRVSREGGGSQRRNRGTDRRKPGGGSTRGSFCSVDPKPLTTSLGNSSLLSTLDSVEKDLLMTHHVYLILSSTKIEVKNALVQEDALALLRQHWRESSGSQTGSGSTLEQNPPAGVSGSTRPPQGPASGTNSSSKGGTIGAGSKVSRQQLQQREQAAAEELQRSEQGRSSRMHFIENPLNTFIPYVQVQEESVSSGGRAHPKGLSQPTIVAEDTEENLFRHAPPFPPEAQRVCLLPIRAYEMEMPTALPAESGAITANQSFSFPPGSSQAGASLVNANASHTAAKRSRVGTSKGSQNLPSPPGTSSGQWGGASSIGASMTQPSASTGGGASFATALPLADEEDTQVARGPLLQLTEHLTELCRSKREEQKRYRKEVKKLLYQYWSQRPSTTEEGAAGSGGAVYPSLIGNRDDDSKRGKA